MLLESVQCGQARSHVLAGGITVETKLARIAETAKNKPKERFTSLVHLLNLEMLKNCHQELKNKKSTGIDEMAKEAYNENLNAEF